ncbi:hypothetical protein [Cellulosilyticum ruminicola]|nr:hypothetical protein [Cellulosilyticum ruminicola]
MRSDSFIQSIVINLIYIIAIIFIGKDQLTIGGLVAFLSYSSLVM